MKEYPFTDQVLNYFQINVCLVLVLSDEVSDSIRRKLYCILNRMLLLLKFGTCYVNVGPSV